MRRSASEIIRNLEMRIARLEKSSARYGLPKKVLAGHIVLASDVNVRQLRRKIEDTFGVDEVEIEDGVLTFFMDKFENKSVEKQVKSIAKKFKVKFEKGGFTEGLGMIYTKQASPKRTPNGIWEDFGDNRKREYVDHVPKARAGDVTPSKYDYKSLILQLANALEPKSNKLYIAMDDGKVKVHLFKKVAEYTETVEVSRGYPDGGASFVLYEAYYSFTEGRVHKAYLRVEDLLVAGGSLVDGKILSKSQANNFISATKRNNGEVY